MGDMGKVEVLNNYRFPNSFAKKGFSRRGGIFKNV